MAGLWEGMEAAVPVLIPSPPSGWEKGAVLQGLVREREKMNKRDFKRYYV